jgi:hypothetical protein
MVTSKKRSLHEHIIAIGVAIFLVAIVFVSINQSWFLTADILQGSETALAAGDVSYNVTENTLSVGSQKIFDDAKSFSFMVVYNPDTVKLDVKNMKTPYDYTSSSWKDGMMNITVFLPSHIDAWQEIVSLPFVGNKDNITISDANMLFNEWNIDGLAIKKQ